MNTWYLQSFIRIQQAAQKFALFHNIFYETNMEAFASFGTTYATLIESIFQSFYKGANTLYLTDGLLQVLLWNNDTTIEKMDGCNWFSQITDFFEYVHA